MIGPKGRIFIFGFLSAIAPLSIDIYLPALPMLRQALAADEAQTLFTLSAFFIGFGVGQLLLGPLSDRFGRKRPLLAGLVIYIIASVACAEATHHVRRSSSRGLSRRSAVRWCPPSCRPWSAISTTAIRVRASCRSTCW